jgi:adenylate cyclase
MAALTLKALLNPKTGAMPAVQALAAALGVPFSTHDQPAPDRHAVSLDGETLGWVSGHAALAQLLSHLAAKEAERRSLAGEVLHLYRESHLIGELSEQLAAVLDIADVASTALAQAQRLIPGSHAAIVVDGATVAAFPDHDAPLGADSPFAASVLERGLGEIVNDFAADPRALPAERRFQSLIAAPLRAKQRTLGLITLADTAGTPYSAAHGKLLNTIAMQAAAAVENVLATQQLLHREVERQALKLYLPPQVAELILASGGSAQLDGVLQPIAVMFADIRGFTTMSEQLEAREIVQMLNEFFTAMSGVIFHNNGTLDKFIGDCIMALFGAPLASANAAADAVNAALGMQREMESLNRSRRARGLAEFHIGIGLHCGPAVVGNIGSADRVQYTAIGDTVNVAARLVGKAAPGQVIVSEDLRAQLPAFPGFQALGEVELKGRASRMHIYEVAPE